MSALFAPLIASGKIKDEAGLKRLFREAVKRVHPDAASDTADHDRFIALYREYEEALALLHGAADMASGEVDVDTPQDPRRSPATAPGGAETGDLPPRFEARAFLDEMMDFIARGFPTRPPVRHARSRYDYSRARVLAMLSAPGGPGPTDYLAFEASFARLDAAGPGARRQAVFDAIYTILGFHHMGWKHLRRQAQRALEGSAAQGSGEEIGRFLEYLYRLAARRGVV